MSLDALDLPTAPLTGADGPGRVALPAFTIVGARVLTPDGVALVRQGGQWVKTTKPRPSAIDDWTHFYYDAKGNATSHDQVVAPPERLQWVGSPRWSRHHDRMSSLSAMVSSQGRVFYIMDEGSRISILLPSKWHLTRAQAIRLRSAAPLWGSQPCDSTRANSTTARVGRHHGRRGAGGTRSSFASKQTMATSSVRGTDTVRTHGPRRFAIGHGTRAFFPRW